jgi:hypothetical protein
MDGLSAPIRLSILAPGRRPCTTRGAATRAAAVHWQMLPRNPADAVRPPKIERGPMTIYDARRQLTCLMLCRALDYASPSCWRCCAAYAVARFAHDGGGMSTSRPSKSLSLRAPSKPLPVSDTRNRRADAVERWPCRQPSPPSSERTESDKPKSCYGSASG